MADTLADLYREVGLESPASRAVREGAPRPLPQRPQVNNPAARRYNEHRRAPQVRQDFAANASRQAYQPPRNQIAELPQLAFETTGIPSLGRAYQGYANATNTSDMQAANEQAINGALGVTGWAVPGLRGEAPRVPRSVQGRPVPPTTRRVWHVSPHEFQPEPGQPVGRFRTDLGGTGESRGSGVGALAYGPGGYFTESPGVRDFYYRQFMQTHGRANVYEAEIPHSGYMDFDTPFGAQPSNIRDGLRDIYGEGPIARDADSRVLNYDEAARMRARGVVGTSFRGGIQDADPNLRNFAVFSGEDINLLRRVPADELGLTEATPSLRPPPRQIGANGMPIAEAQPFRNSMRGGSADLAEAAGMRGPDAGGVRGGRLPPDAAPPAAVNANNDLRTQAGQVGEAFDEMQPIIAGMFERMDVTRRGRAPSAAGLASERWGTNTRFDADAAIAEAVRSGALDRHDVPGAVRLIAERGGDEAALQYLNRFDREDLARNIKSGSLYLDHPQQDAWKPQSADEMRDFLLQWSREPRPSISDGRYSSLEALDNAQERWRAAFQRRFVPYSPGRRLPPRASPDGGPAPAAAEVYRPENARGETVATEQFPFGFRPVSDEPWSATRLRTDQFYPVDTKVDYGDAEGVARIPPTQIPLRSLTGTQESISSRFLERPATSDEPISVYRTQTGQHYIMDGHHRAASAAARGDQNVSARVFSAERPPVNLNEPRIASEIDSHLRPEFENGRWRIVQGGRVLRELPDGTTAREAVAEAASMRNAPNGSPPRPPPNGAKSIRNTPGQKPGFSLSGALRRN